MRVVSLFAGIGGFDLGFERAGFEIVAHVEKDENCRRLLAARWPGAVALDDVCTAGAHNLPACDVVVGGSPCQGFSVAGLRKGRNDERSNLTVEFVRICNELNPAIVVWENVPGVLSMHDNSFGHFLAAMVGADEPFVCSDGEGWSSAGVAVGPCRACGWRVLDAQWFGVAQRRRRVFLVGVALGRQSSDVGERAGIDSGQTLFPVEKSNAGHSAACSKAGQNPAPSTSMRSGIGGEQWGVERVIDILFEPRCVNNGQPRRETGQGVAWCLESRTQGGGFPGMDGAYSGHVVTAPLTGNPYGDHESRESLLVPDVARTVSCNTARGGIPSTDGLDGALIPAVARSLNAGRDGYNDGSDQTYIPAVAGCLQERDAKGTDSDRKPGHLVPVAVRTANTQANGHGIAQNVTHTLDGAQGQAVGVPVAQVQWASGGGKVYNPTAQSLRSGAEHNYQFAQVGMQVRRLTPRCCERLQGFQWRCEPSDPGAWQDELGRWWSPDYTNDFSDSTRYKMLGNAVCVNVSEWIARRLAACQPS